MIETTPLLSEKETQAIHALASAISNELKDRLIGIWLFGSKARGDASPDSDLDILVVVDHLAPPVRWRIREIAADCSLEYDILINSHIQDMEKWEKEAKQKTTFRRELNRDGVPIPFLNQPTPNSSI